MLKSREETELRDVLHVLVLFGKQRAGRSISLAVPVIYLNQ